MNNFYVIHDLSDDGDIIVLKVIKPNIVTLNKLIETSDCCITNTAPKYDNSWTDFKRTRNTAFPYYGDDSFVAAVYGNDQYKILVYLC